MRFVFFALIGLLQEGSALPKPDPANATVKVAQVGDIVINKFQLQLLQRIEQIKSGGDTLEESEVLLLLMTMAADETVARKLGEAVTAEQLKNERARVEKETRDPASLKQILALTDPHPGMFDDLVLKSYLPGMRVRRAFSRDRKFHAKPLAAAEALLKKALGSASAFAKAEGIVRHDSTAGMVHDREKAKKIAEGIPEEAKAGEVWSSLVDDETGYYVVKLIERRIGAVIFEAVRFPKEKIEPWMRDQLKDVKVEVFDPRLKTTLKETSKGNVVVDLIR